MHANHKQSSGGGREPGRIGAGSGRRMRDIKFFNDFLVPF